MSYQEITLMWRNVAYLLPHKGADMLKVVHMRIGQAASWKKVNTAIYWSCFADSRFKMLV